MENREYYNEAGHCPMCNSMNITYNNRPTIDGNNMFFEYHCHNCGCDGEEIYYVELTGNKFWDEKKEEEIELEY